MVLRVVDEEAEWGSINNKRIGHKTELWGTSVKRQVNEDLDLEHKIIYYDSGCTINYYCFG